jgi:hypothetical protein
MSAMKMYVSDIEVQRTLPKWKLRIKAEKACGSRNAAWVSRTSGRRSLPLGRVTLDMNSANVLQV